MNTFEQLEEQAANGLFTWARTHAAEYAQLCDQDAATIALLLRALELAGGACFIKPQDEK